MDLRVRILSSLLLLGGLIPATTSAKTPAAITQAAESAFSAVNAVSRGSRNRAGTTYAVTGVSHDGRVELRRLTLDGANKVVVSRNLLPKVQAAVQRYAGPKVEIQFEGGGFSASGNPLFLIRPEQVNESQVVYSWKTAKVSAAASP
jgi:hypothetical protein